MGKLLSFEDYSFTYAGQAVAVLRGVDLSLERGSFTVLCGASGSGKTTLLRAAVPSVTPSGTVEGCVRFAEGSAAMVMQEPENSLIHRELLDDLVFGMENAAIPREEMTVRLAEVCGYLGLEPLLRRAPDTLSGGQKQLAALAAALLMRPALLVLDEPTAQLDPLTARDFYALLRLIHRQFGITVLLCEHRLDEVLPLVDTLVLLRDGCVAAQGKPVDVLPLLPADAMPALPRLAVALGCAPVLTVGEARAVLPPVSAWSESVRAQALPRLGGCDASVTALRCKQVYFGYEKSVEVLRGLDLTVQGGLTCLLGGNGSGKSTLLRLCAGLHKPQSGKVLRDKAIGYLPQESAAFILHDTVYKEFCHGLPDGQAPDAALLASVGLDGLLERHPFDLSVGQRQVMMLVSLLLARPALLLLDEPTCGLDGACAAQMAALIRGSGIPTLAATHDSEWAARYADECCLLFDGVIAHRGAPRRFFARHWLSTTAVYQAFPPTEDVL